MLPFFNISAGFGEDDEEQKRAETAGLDAGGFRAGRRKSLDWLSGATLAASLRGLVARRQR